MIVHDLLSMEIMISRNMTFDNTTYDQLAEMTADVLAQVVAAEEEVRVAIEMMIVVVIDCSGERGEMIDLIVLRQKGKKRSGGRGGQT